MHQNVIVMRFEDASLALPALAELKAASAAGRLQLLQAALMERDAQGWRRSAEAGLAAGPVVGALMGSAVLQQWADSMPPGSTALIACVREFTETVVDDLASEQGAVVWRRPLAEVQAEVAAPAVKQPGR